MYRWCVDYKRNIAGEVTTDCYSCSSFSEALRNAEKIWSSISDEEKENNFRYSIKVEGHLVPFYLDSIHLQVILTETDDEGKIIDIYNAGVFECKWMYKYYCIMHWDSKKIVDRFDTYTESFKKLKEYPKGDYVLCAPNGEEESDLSWLVIDRVINYSDLRAEKFANSFGIPKRTVDNWIYGVNEPTEYLLGLLAKEVAEYVKVNDVWGGEGRNV